MKIQIHDLLKRRAVITRHSARAIGEALRSALEGAKGELIVDFAGVEAVTPSFVDELLSVIEEVTATESRIAVRLLFVNLPTRLSAKFAAIGRARGVEIREAQPGSWTIAAPSSRA